MAGITLPVAEARLTEYLDAEAKILGGQAFSRNGKAMTRADLAAVQAGIALWQSRVMKLSRSGRLAVVEVIPR
ncbi:MAG: hypothetical protein ACOYB1_18350 [Limnohabitans sp.]